MAYLHALRFRSLTSLYDPVVAATTRERAFKQAVIDEAAVAPGQRVLDLGCGTGTLALMIKRAVGQASVTGVDGDSAMLAQARGKAAAGLLEVEWIEAMAQEIPIGDATFDVAVSSLFFHHLDPASKRSAMNELSRLIRPGGRVVIADWGRPGDPLMWATSRALRLFDGPSAAESLAGGLPAIMKSAGFAEIQERRSFRTAFGRMVVHSATRP